MAQVCKLFCYTATLDCLYTKFEEMYEGSSSYTSSLLSNQMFEDELGVDFVNGKLKAEERGSARFVEKLQAINPALNIMKPIQNMPRKTVIGSQVINNIPEEESEWASSIDTPKQEKDKQRSMKEIINDFIYNSEVKVFRNNTKGSNPNDWKKLDTMNNAKLTKMTSDRLNNTMVFSEKGDGYTDSQHLNEGLITLESRDLAKSPYHIGKIRLSSIQKEGSVYLFQKMNSNTSTITDNYMKQTDNDRSFCSNNQPSSYASSKRLPVSLQKRNSQFVRLPFGSNLLKLTSKQSSSSIRKYSQLGSILEHPSEDAAHDANEPTKNTLDVKNPIGQKRKSVFPVDTGSLFKFTPRNLNL